MLRTHEAGTLRADHCRPDRHAHRLGRPSARSRRSGVPRPARRQRHRPGRRPRRGPRAGRRPRPAQRVLHPGRPARSAPRPEGNANPDLPTGEIEVVASEIEVLNASAPLPFQIDERVDRRRGGAPQAPLPRPAPPRCLVSGAAIRLRCEVNAAARAVLGARDFVEIETPTLTRSTPEGARDFLVPARLAPGSWYALPQSPQLFKQLLMVAGMERYYQIARCYRDEDFRADRQPEFTQLDIEMSFVEQDDVIELGEEVVTALWKLIGVELPTPFPQMTYADAMRRFGSDKPDLRFGNELVECTEYFADTPFRVFQAEYVGAVVMPGGAAQPRKQLDAWQDWAKSRGARGLAYVLVQEDGDARRPGRQEPLRRRARRPGRPRRRPARRLRLLRRRCHQVVARPARGGPARDRPALRPHRRGRLGVPLGARRPAVRAVVRRRRQPATSPSAPAPGPRCTTRSPRPRPSSSTPSTPTPARRSPTPTTWSATATRSAAGRSVSTAATCRSGSSR